MRSENEINLENSLVNQSSSAGRKVIVQYRTGRMRWQLQSQRDVMRVGEGRKSFCSRYPTIDQWATVCGQRYRTRAPSVTHWNTYTWHLSQTLRSQTGEGHGHYRICYNCDNKFRPILDWRRQLLTFSVKGVYIFSKYLSGHRRLGLQATTHSHSGLQF